MLQKHGKFGIGLAVSALTLSASPAWADDNVFTTSADATVDLWDAISSPKENKRYTDSYCKQTGALCGAIAYANGGGYVVSWVEVKAKSTQPSSKPVNGVCPGLSKKFDSNVQLNEYDTFIVPANCLYKLKINIASGPKKDRDIFLTPGCVAQTWTKGTTGSNSWHHDISWSDQAKQNGASGDPQDSFGNKCTVK